MTRRHSANAIRNWGLLAPTIIVLTACFSWATPPLSAGQRYWHFLIHPQAVVAGPYVTFGEIASPLTEQGRAQWASLAQRQLWPAPESGRTMTLSGTRILNLLGEHLGEIAAVCRTPSQVVLQGGGRVILEEELRSRLVTFLTPQARLLGEEISLRDFRLPSHVFLRQTQDTIAIEPARALQPGRNSFRFVIRAVDGSVLRRLTGTVFLDVWQTVPCASRPLNPGTALEPEDVTFQRKNLAYLREAPWDGSGGPWQVRSPVGMNQVIYASSLRPLPAVRKGDLVLLVYEGDLIRLQIQAQVLADGAIGATIPVRNLQNNNEVLARVRDFETVVVR